MQQFTPTQDLVLEVLISRARLGEKTWIFDRRLKKAIEDLEAEGWVKIVGETSDQYGLRARLTDRAIARWLSVSYEAKMKSKNIKDQVKTARKMRKKFGGKNFWESEQAAE